MEYKYSWDFLNDARPYDFRNKKQAIRNYIITMLNRTRRIFEYENLPETIPAKFLENYLQINGFACIAKAGNDSIYAFFGGLGGIPDEYYFPTICTVANPALNLSKQYKINEDCIIIQNDTMLQGILPICIRYATQISENDISIDMAIKNLRNSFLLSAQDEGTIEAANKYLQDIEAGVLGVVAENRFLEGIKAQPLATASQHTITELIEMQQYCKASWYNELGLNANYNMKREALSMTESQMNFDALLPLIDDMLECRKDGIEKVNALFGTNISVRLSSSWEKIEMQAELSAHAESPENTDTSTESEQEMKGDDSENEKSETK